MYGLKLVLIIMVQFFVCVFVVVVFTILLAWDALVKFINLLPSGTLHSTVEYRKVKVVTIADDLGIKFHYRAFS